MFFEIRVLILFDLSVFLVDELNLNDFIWICLILFKFEMIFVLMLIVLILIFVLLFVENIIFIKNIIKIGVKNIIVSVFLLWNSFFIIFLVIVIIFMIIFF